jgi:hypothetical protein
VQPAEWRQSFALPPTKLNDRFGLGKPTSAGAYGNGRLSAESCRFVRRQPSSRLSGCVFADIPTGTITSDRINIDEEEDRSDAIGCLAFGALRRLAPRRRLGI